MSRNLNNTELEPPHDISKVLNTFFPRVTLFFLYFNTKDLFCIFLISYIQNNRIFLRICILSLNIVFEVHPYYYI